MTLDFDYLKQAYFAFDLPVKYNLKKGNVSIRPVSLTESGILLTSLDILNVDKNSYPDVRIIRMSYLEFLAEILLADKEKGKISQQKLINILCLCLGLKRFGLRYNEKDELTLYDDELNIEITPKEFDDIRRIIMYQNIPNFDDSYVNPDLKQAMDETDALRNGDKESPDIERRIAIITSHCGLPKREQLQMTYRSHSMLFEEVCGEVEFTTIRPVALFAGSKTELEHWIFKNKKNKFDGYIKSADAYTKDLGSNGAIKTSDSTVGDNYMQQFNSF